MKKHAARHTKARMIRAAACPQPFQIEAAAVDWIAAADDAGTADKPKRFSMVAYTGGPMMVGWYSAPVVIELSGLTAKAPLPILLNHDTDRIVGHADEIDVGDSTLKLAGLLSGASAESAQVAASAKLGFPWKASVGARPDRMEFIAEGVATTVNGKSHKGPLYVARRATLGEVSFVPIAADPKTSTKVAASAAQPQGESSMDPKFLEYLKAKGIDPATIEAAALKQWEADWLKAHADPEPAPAPPPPDPVQATRAVQAAELKRVADIAATCTSFAAKVPADKLAAIQAQAVADGWDVSKTELACMKAATPPAPPVHSPTRDVNPRAIEAAFALSCGLRQPERHYDAPTLEAAGRHRGIGLQELLLAHARQAGYTGRERITRDNYADVMRAAFSTHTITTLLTSTGNKVLLEGFNSIPASWREVAQVRSVSDFKSVTAYRMTATLEYQELAPDGEIQHGTLGQESYTMQAKTYARMLALTRTDIINDDLGAFNDLRNRLGIGAAIKLNKVFWTAWTAAYNGAAFWTAARGNLVTSASLGAAGLGKAVKAFRDLAGPDGNLLNLEPDRMLVPSDLEATARILYASQEERDTTASTRRGIANIYFNRFRPIVVPELGNSAYTGYSATTWYLLANPAVLASALVCFLNGQEAPTIESADTDFDTLGIQFRGYHDFGVSMSEYRASVAAEA